VGIFLPSLVLYSAFALTAAYWLGWLRLANRRASHVIIEAVALGILLLSMEQMLIMLTLKWVGPSYLRNTDAFIWFTYLARHPALFVWTVLLATAIGALGVGLANSCAGWSLVRQGARRSTPVADFFKVYATCALLLAAAAVTIQWTHISSVSGSNLVVVVALIVATLLAVRSGKHRLNRV
jgi:hypothetical protein